MTSAAPGSGRVPPALPVLPVGRLPDRPCKGRAPLRLVALAAACGAVALALHPLGAPVLPAAIALGAALYIASAPLAALARLVSGMHTMRAVR